MTEAKKEPPAAEPPAAEPREATRKPPDGPHKPPERPQRPAPPERRFRSGLIYVLLLIVFILTLRNFVADGGIEVTYGDFLIHLRAGHVREVYLADDRYTGRMLVPQSWQTPSPEALQSSEAPASADSPASSDSPAPAEVTAPSETPAPSEAPDSSEAPASSRAPATAETTALPKGPVSAMAERLPADGKEFLFTVVPVKDDDLVKELEAAQQRHGTQFAKRPGDGFWTTAVLFLAPFLLVIGFFYLMMRQSGQVGRAALSFGKTRAKLYAEKIQSVTFADVAGCDEAKEELQEVVEFLRSPKKYQSLGGRMPKGILLVGPPGTGKTLLARAVAGESKTPFFSLSGSDFVEMFVGVGAARVRDLFQQAKHRAPCIVFVDELDAVGRHRGAGLGGGHDEREQTLNQLLVEMDGFDTTQGVIFLAATNRPDVLDPALLRPGRFDRQVVIDAPDANGRKAILRVHSRNKPFSKDIDFDLIAGNTPGFTGADLANVLNEAALLAARRGLAEIGRAEVEEAVERSIAGPERRSRRLGEEERKRVAFHEAGHALVAALSPNADPVRKISIIPRGHAALGYTMQFPTDDRYLITQGALFERLKGLLAGRAAEDLVFGEISTGAGDDLKKASEIARTMVCRLGMSEKLGPVAYGRDQQQVFLGRDLRGEERNYSESTAQEIDVEVRRIVEEANREAEQILREHRVCLDHLAQTLLEREVMQGSELDELLRRELTSEGAPAHPGAPPKTTPEAHPEPHPEGSAEESPERLPPPGASGLG